MGNEVRLVDLEVIKRYSLAVRQESAEAEDLLAALDASRETVLASMPPPDPDPDPEAEPDPEPEPEPRPRRQRRSAS